MMVFVRVAILRKLVIAVLSEFYECFMPVNVCRINAILGRLLMLLNDSFRIRNSPMKQYSFLPRFEKDIRQSLL